MKIAFTICSNNYLAQAITLGQSLHATNPDYLYFIALVDRKSPSVNYELPKNQFVIPVDEMGIEDLDGMNLRYTILELNTAVKPSVFSYLFEKYSSSDSVIYFDPDIYIYRRLDELEGILSEYNVVLTPHFTTPIYDDKKLSEPDILNAGIFNLGFIALKNSDESKRLVEWWKIKLRYECRVAFDVGLFVDQLWMNFAPVYFDMVMILKSFGYNMAYWNLHERKIVENNDQYFVNDLHTPLVFFHFSGYTFNNPDVLSKYQNRYELNDRPDIMPLFRNYHTHVVNNGFGKYSKIPCYYVQLRAAHDKDERRKNNIVKRAINYGSRKGWL